jgi:hypothetical protein
VVVFIPSIYQRASSGRGVPEKIKQVPSVKLEFGLKVVQEYLDSVLRNVIFSHHPWDVPVILTYEYLRPVKETKI